MTADPVCPRLATGLLALVVADVAIGVLVVKGNVVVMVLTELAGGGAGAEPPEPV